MFCFGVENFGSYISSAKNSFVGAVSAVGRFAAAKVGKEDWPIRGLELIIWSDGQLEASEKNTLGGDIYINI